MIFKFKKFLVATVLSTLAVLCSLNSEAYAAADATFTRISGQNRYETAVEISKRGWSHSDTVVLAYGQDFADGLTGVTLAYLKDAPILLTTKDQLPQVTSSEIQRLGANKIYILGGTGVISSNIEKKLKLLNYNVERISGINRFQTATAVGKQIKNSDTNTAIIATAYDFPDTLSIGPAAARNNMPILFTHKDNLTSETKQALIKWNIKKVVISGGTGVVSSQVESQVKALGISVERLSGKDRYDTSLSIAKKYNKIIPNDIVLAKGEDFPDALAGGAFAAKNNLPILLTSKENISDKILNYFDELNIQDIYILGGTGAISNNVKESIKYGKFGNTEGNIINGGYAVKQGDWIYYCKYDSNANYPMAPNSSSIYKMKSDRSSNTKLITAYASHLNIKGEWLYYISKSDNKIYKVKTNGKNNQKVSDITVSNDMIIVGNWIYVSNDNSSIRKIKLDGSEYDHLWGTQRDFIVYGDNIYFNYMGDDDSIWKTTSNSYKLNDEPSYHLNIYRNNIYFNDTEDNICSISIDGGSKNIIGTDRASSILVDEGWLYYSNKNDNDKLYKMKIDGTNKTKLSNSSIFAFNVVGDWIVYVSNAKTNFIKK